MHEVLVNRLGGLSLPRKSVVRSTDRLDMTIYVYRVGKTFFPIFIHFSFSLHFLSKVSPQLYRIGSSYLVYGITMTSCIVGRITVFVLFVFP